MNGSTVALDENYIDEEKAKLIEDQDEKVYKLINGYIAGLDRPKKG